MNINGADPSLPFVDGRRPEEKSCIIRCDYAGFVSANAVEVEVEGFEPSSKRGTNGLSTCLVVTWFSESGRLTTTNSRLIL